MNCLDTKKPHNLNMKELKIWFSQNKKVKYLSRVKLNKYLATKKVKSIQAATPFE